MPPPAAAQLLLHTTATSTLSMVHHVLAELQFVQESLGVLPLHITNVPTYHHHHHHHHHCSPLAVNKAASKAASKLFELHRLLRCFTSSKV